MEKNFQLGKWDSDFGKEYTERNFCLPTDLDLLYTELYNKKRSSMNIEFLEELNIRDKSILEVGCNTGDQLRLLREQGYQKLYGIELQQFAIEKAREYNKNLNIIQGLAQDISFKDDYFDLVYTSGVLIHISPDDLGKIMDEIYRCSKKYIWGFEYYADTHSEIQYRGNGDLMWKGNFAQMYLERFGDLELVKEVRYKYVDSENEDSMFLLKKV